MASKQLVFLILIVVCLGWYCFYADKAEQSVHQSDNRQITETIKTIRGNSMEPLLKAGEEIVLLEGHYQCYSIQKGDIAAYDYKGNDNPLIKKIMVVGGDALEFEENSLLVNGEILVNSRQEAYIFSEKQKKLISLYIKNGKLVDNGYLIFGENIRDGLDSRRFGAVGSSGFLGKFEF